MIEIAGGKSRIHQWQWGLKVLDSSCYRDSYGVFQTGVKAEDALLWSL
jgi:hypothetical protein